MLIKKEAALVCFANRADGSDIRKQVQEILERGDSVEKGAEQRKFDRFPLGFKVDVHALEEEGSVFIEEVFLQDISSGGFCFLSAASEKYSVGQRLYLSIHLPDVPNLSPSMEGEVTVAWIGGQQGDLEESARSRIGVIMTDMMAFNSAARDPKNEASK